MKKIILIAMLSQLIYADDKEQICKQLVHDAAVSTTLEVLCGFNGNVGRKIFYISDTLGCYKLIGTKQVRKSVDEVNDYMIKTYKKIGKKKFCSEYVKPYKDSYDFCDEAIGNSKTQTNTHH